MTTKSLQLANALPCLTDCTPKEIAELLDLKPFQGRQIFKWIHNKQVENFEVMSDLSKALREELPRECRIRRTELLSVQNSENALGTHKALFRLDDNETVESVLIRDEERRTICLSTQVGCAIRCSFCATGFSGFTRNLTPGEIVEQALHMVALEHMGERTPNIVFMGMGEPFRNYDATMKAIHLLMEREGLNIGARKITVSTVGDVAGIRRFAVDGGQVRLSVSLHAANDRLRSELIPLNRKYPLAVLMEAVRDYIELTGRQITFEWVLLKEINDRIEDAKELAALAAPLKAFVNLIPWNAISDVQFETPSRRRCEVFRDILMNEGVSCTLRQERGGDIDAACGQLRRRAAKVGFTSTGKSPGASLNSDES